MEMIFYGATDTGRVRTNNEDDFISEFLWDDRHVLCVAIDGLGGYEGGEVAAAIAHESIVNYLKGHRMGDCLELLKQAVTQANNNIVDRQAQDPGRSKMGCVVTAGLFDLEQGRLNVAHVGDSRLYQYHDSTLRKLTHDHSLVGYREDNGELTEEQAMNHPQRNIVERVLGEKLHQLDDKNFIEAAIFPLLPGAFYLFCSDGLSDMLTSAEIADIIERQRDNLHGCVDGLIAAACDHGGKDNVTVVVARCQDDGTSRRAATATGEKTDAPAPTPANPGPRHGMTARPVAKETTAAPEGDGYRRATTERPPRRRSLWDTLLWLLVAMVACAAACYGGYYYRGLEHADQEAALRQSKDSTISVLQDSITHLQERIYDQSLELDSVK